MWAHRTKYLILKLACKLNPLHNYQGKILLSDLNLFVIKMSTRKNEGYDHYSFELLYVGHFFIIKF